MDNVERIAQFDPRVQIPVLIRIRFPENPPEDSGDERHLKNALGFPLDWAWSSCMQCLKERAWYTLISAGEREVSKGLRQNVVLLLGFIGMLGSSAAAWMGVILLLWNVLPLWLSNTLSAFLFLSYICAILFTINLLYNQNIDVLLNKNDIIVIVYVFSMIITLNIYILILSNGKELEHLLITKKINFWFPIALLVAVVGNGVLGGFAVHAWFHLTLTLSMFVIGFSGLLGSMLVEWGYAFSEGAMYPWLIQRPHGKVVLDEFRR